MSVVMASRGRTGLESGGKIKGLGEEVILTAFVKS